MLSANHVIPDLPPLPHEVAGFRHLARLRKLGRLFLIAFLAAAVLAFFLSPPIGIIVIMGLTLLLTVGAIAEQWAHCPRCGDFCFQKGLRRGIPSSRCLHCNTKLYWSGAELAEVSVTSEPPTSNSNSHPV